MAWHGQVFRGDALKIEAIKLQGKGELKPHRKPRRCAMKESAQIAHSVVKVLLENGKLKSSAKSSAESKSKQRTKDPLYAQYTIHLHFQRAQHQKMVQVQGLRWQQ